MYYLVSLHILYEAPNKVLYLSLYVLLRLRKTQNALQLPVFFFFSFFCQRYVGYRNYKSVFLILKIWHRIEIVS